LLLIFIDFSGFTLGGPTLSPCAVNASLHLFHSWAAFGGVSEGLV
jgi:hypothetical protein